MEGIRDNWGVDGLLDLLLKSLGIVSMYNWISNFPVSTIPLVLRLRFPLSSRHADPLQFIVY